MDKFSIVWPEESTIVSLGSAKGVEAIAKTVIPENATWKLSRTSSAESSSNFVVVHVQPRDIARGKWLHQEGSGRTCLQLASIPDKQQLVDD